MIKRSSDGKVRFYEGKHTYYLGKQKLKSVTTLIHDLFNKFDAEGIAPFSAKKQTRERGYKVTTAMILKEWKENNKKATDRGTLIHYEMEKWLLDKDKVLLPVYHPASQHGVKWVDNYLASLDVLKIIPEELIYNKDYLIAGQSDLVVYHSKGVDVIDWKTNKEILKKSKYYKKGIKPYTKHLSDCNFNHYSIQLSIYAYFLELQGNKINRLLLPHLTEDGVVLYEIEYMRDVVIEILKDFKSTNKNK